MIKSFKNKGLQELDARGKTGKINKKFHARLLRMIDVLKNAESLDDVNLPGYKLHGLTGFKPKRYTISVNGPWRITFTFEDGNAAEVDFENYH
ncbi:MAG: plasmid maintenance system killer [Alphaproteobacteria bacterium]|nr:plasmid maintenance system killer [Alphaproteobacteria bacterium]